MGQDDWTLAMHPGVCPERRNELSDELVMRPADKPGIVLFRGFQGLYEHRCSFQKCLVLISDFTNTEEELPVFDECPKICGTGRFDDLFKPPDWEGSQADGGDTGTRTVQVDIREPVLLLHGNEPRFDPFGSGIYGKRKERYLQGGSGNGTDKKGSKGISGLRL